MLKECKNKEIYVVSIYLSSKFAESILNESTNVIFTSLFYNNGLIKYHKYIERGGVMIGDDEGDFSSRFIMFKKGNFVEYFKNLWKNYFNL